MSTPKTARATFPAAVEAAECLELRPGLDAIKSGEGKGQIEAKDPRALRGSVRMDDDCQSAFPNDSRWDYVIGVARAESDAAFFVEVHGADTSDVSKLADKFRWLRDYLERPRQVALRSLPREVHWVAHDGVKILKHSPQYKRLVATLRPAGLRGPVKHLTLA